MQSVYDERDKVQKVQGKDEEGIAGLVRGAQRESRRD